MNSRQIFDFTKSLWVVASWCESLDSWAWECVVGLGQWTYRAGNRQLLLTLAQHVSRVLMLASSSQRLTSSSQDFSSVLVSPLILLAGFVVLVTLGRPVFYSHDRIGLHGAPFRLHKLRTMVPDRRQRPDRPPAKSRDV